jgi:predicted amidohydrolase YtcJ
MKAAALFLLSAPCLFASDMILIHGQVYTGKAATPWAEALSLTGTRIEAVGSDAEVSRSKTAQTKVIASKGAPSFPAS